MNRLVSRVVLVLAATLVVPPAAAKRCAAEETWTRALEAGAPRGKLHDASLLVRGDTGRWQDADRIAHAPPPKASSARLALDDELDKWSQEKFPATDADDHWLLFSTAQHNDNDRLWIERIERHGGKFLVIAQQARWTGDYFKNFTYYPVLGVNLGKLEPGDYEAVVQLQPHTFTRFDADGKPKPENWPADATAAGGKPTELRTTFTVGKGAR